MPEAGIDAAERRFAEIGNLSLAYLDAGDGPAVVMLHGLGTSADLWRHQVDALAPAHRVVCPDLRGFGQSSKPYEAEAYSVEWAARDVFELLDLIGVERCALVGTSMGGYVALTMTVLSPERFDRLALLHTACSRQVPAQLLRTRVEALSRSATMAEYAQVVVAEALHPETPETVRAVLSEMIARNDKSVYGILLASPALDFDVCSSLPSTLPVLVITSPDDRVVPTARSVQLASSIPGAMLVEMSRSGHISPIEQPDDVNAVLLPFLSAATLPQHGGDDRWRFLDVSAARPGTVT